MTTKYYSALRRIGPWGWLAIVVVAAILFAAMINNANATDLYRDDEPRSTNWNGCGIGAGAGYGMGSTDTDINVNGFGTILNIDGLASDDYSISAYVQCDRQVGWLVIGAWAEYQIHESETTVTIAGLAPLALMEFGDAWSAGGRAGVPVIDGVLAYVKAGYVEREFAASSPLAGLTFLTDDLTGVVYGGGVEVALTPNIRLAVEGLIEDYSNESFAIIGPVSATTDTDRVVIQGRLVYNFGAMAF